MTLVFLAFPVLHSFLLVSSLLRLHFSVRHYHGNTDTPPLPHTSTSTELTLLLSLRQHDTTPQILHSDVDGEIQIKCFLSGMPECKFGLNDKACAVPVFASECSVVAEFIALLKQPVQCVVFLR
jgi:adaptor complexes medium subunit family protein